jgi:DNA-binding response OmpR family regulator
MTVMPGSKLPDAPVLVVEDDDMAAEIFGLSLREAGYHVQLVHDAEAALSFVEHDLPSVMIVDLRLPTLDGLALLRRLKAQPKLAAVPVAIVTGDYFVDEDVVKGFAELGARIFFKPIWQEDLVHIVGDLLSDTHH